MNQKGVTLIELLVTLTIISILASVVLPMAQINVKRSKEIELKRNLREIRSAIDEYKKAWNEGRIKKNIDDSGYPPDLVILVEGAEDIKSPKAGLKIRFLRRIPRDPMCTDDFLEPQDTWGLRSYSSGPDDPKEGDDVYDIYSRSEETAIDGTPYSKW